MTDELHKPPWVIDFIKNFGWPVALLAGLLFGGYKIAVKITNELLIPVANKHIQLLHDTIDENKAQTKDLNSINTSAERTAGNTEQIKEQLKIRPSDVLEAVERMEKKLDEGRK